MKAYSNNFTSLQDCELVAQVVNQVEPALEELYRRHSPLLRNVIMRIMSNDAEIDDVLQDVFLQVWQQAANFSTEKGSFKAWLITLARRRSLDRVRQRSAYQRATNRFELEVVAPAEDMAETSTVDQEVQHNEMHELLEKLIETNLPVEQGEAVRLSFFQGLSQRQIAAHLSLPLGTVKTRIELGVRKLSRSSVFTQSQPQSAAAA